MNKVKEGYKTTDLGIIPEAWNIKKLNNVFERITDKNKDNYSYNVLTISAQMGLVNQEEFFNKNIASKNISNYYLLNRGDFAYNKSYSAGYPMGAIKRLNKYDKGIVSPLYICFRKKSELISGKFYEYFFEYTIFDNAIASIAQEGARNHGLLNVNIGDFFELPIIVPPIEEQEKIASILSTVDEQIDNVDALIEKNKELKKGLMQTLLTKGIGHTKFKKTEIGEIPEEWEIKELSELYSENIRDFGSFSTTKLIEYVEEGIPYLRAENFRENKIVLNSVSYITDEVDKLLDKSYVYDGNILFTKIGNIGCATVYRGELGTRCNSNATIAKIKIDENIYDSNYIVYFLNSLQCKKQYIGSIISTPPRINMGEISKFKIAIPKLYEQTKIASILLKVDSKIEEYENKKIMFEGLKNGLMQQLLTGKTRIC